MTKNRVLFLQVAAFITACYCNTLFAEEQVGSLLFDVEEYTTELNLKKKWHSRIRVIPILWGIEGKQLIITQVNKNQLTPEFPYETRYGEKETIELAEGEYKATCVGFNLNSSSGNVDKVLSKSAFLNLDVLSFTIHAGKTTTFEVQPEIVKHSTWAMKMWLPVLHVRVMEDGVEKTAGVLCSRTPEAISWDDYAGPLKF